MTAKDLGRYGVLVLGAVMIAALAYFAACKANNVYYQRNPILGDTASYWQRDGSFARIAEKMNTSYREKQSYIIHLNPKDPLRTIFFAFRSPEAPYAINGHLSYAACAVFLFTLALSLMLFFRTHSFVYALAGPFALFMAEGFFSPMYGLPSKLPDMTAALLMGASLFTLFAGMGRKKEIAWVAAAGLLLGVATLARYHVWIYGLFVMGPLVFMLGCRHYVATRKKYWLALYPAVLLAGLSLVAGWFIAEKTRDMFIFYSSAGYSLNSTVLTAINSTGRKFFVQFLGETGMLTLGFMTVIYASQRIAGRLSRFDGLMVAWAALSYFLLLLVIMRVDDIIEQSYYAIPGLMIAMLAPFCLRPEAVREYGFSRYAKLLLIGLPFMSWFHFNQYTGSEAYRYPRPEGMAQKEMQSKLTDFIGVQATALPGRNIVVDSDFQYYTRFLEPIVRAKFGKQMDYPNIFQIRESQWNLFWRARNPQQDKSTPVAVAKMGLAAYQELTSRVDLYLALTNPLDNMWQSAFADEYTRDASHVVNAEIAKHPDVWQALGKVNGPYGVVTVYKNQPRYKQ